MRHLLTPLSTWLLFVLFPLAQQTLGQEPAAGSKDSRWAVAIHGGAGGNPQEWSQEKRAARRKGIERTLTLAVQQLKQGAAAIDVVEQVIVQLENDPAFNAGRGSVRTSAGRVEMDASIMDGKSLRCGAVASVTRVRNPISLARTVMDKTRHILLMGEGAEAFAESQNIELVAPSYFLSRNAPPTEDETHFGTVGCVVLDSSGNLAAGTSTGGLEGKMPGRVGDSPLIGAGTYATNQACAVSGTGVGEEFIRNAVAYDIAARMRYQDTSLEQAIRHVLTETLDPGVAGLIGVDKEGNISLQHNTSGMTCGAADSEGRRDVYLSVTSPAGN